MGKVILMYPNCRWVDGWENKTIWNLHPYNLGVLSATLEDSFDTGIFDANIDNISKDDFYDFLKRENPDIVGISVLTNEYGESGLIGARIAKLANPNIKTIIGGVHATSNPESIITDSSVDYVVLGEGEYVLKDLCNHILHKKSIPSKGVVFKNINGEVVNTGMSNFIENLDALPLPSYDKVDFMKYATSVQRESVDRPRAMPYANILTSRGCPYQCCFCEAGKISGKKPRLRSIENVIGEIEWLKEKYHINALIFDDDNLVIDKNRAKGLFKKMIQRKLNLKWNAIAMAAYKLDDEIIGLMKESGCEYVDIAIESGVKRVLHDIIHKPLDLDKAKNVSKSLMDAGIDLAANFIVGFPGETWEEIRQTIKFAEELNADYTKIFIATPLPNTELYEIAKKGGYLRKGFNFNKHLWSDGWIETEEFRPQDLKILRAYEWDRLNFSNSAKREKIADMMGITEDRLNEIRKETLNRANP
ncbi:MAG: radical SAM protein [Nanoarchaeota archaeon]